MQNLIFNLIFLMIFICFLNLIEKYFKLECIHFQYLLHFAMILMSFIFLNVYVIAPYSSLRHTLLISLALIMFEYSSLYLKNILFVQQISLFFYILYFLKLLIQFINHFIIMVFFSKFIKFFLIFKY